MKALVILEAVFLQTPSGEQWTNGVFTASFFTRYLAVFDRVIIAARIRLVDAVPDDHQRIGHPQITFHPLPWYRGLLGYLRHRKRVLATLKQALDQAEAVIVRAPSPLAGRLQGCLSRRPFGVEVVGDPWDVFGPGAIRHPLRPWLRRRLRDELQWQCQHACASAYVTASALQQRYPPEPGAPSFSYSSIELTDSCFVASPRAKAPTRPLRLVSVGTMSQAYKGHDVLIRAIAHCRNDLSIELVLLGDGKERSALEHLCSTLNLTKMVTFLGHLGDRAAVQAELDKADAFVLASRQEGLPRALIEAMARGLPCLGTRIGGIPELLEDDALVPVGDHVALAELMRKRLSDAAWMTTASARNLSVARTYHQDLLRQRRELFYQSVRNATAHWLATK